jgi:hypothetical protein
VKQDFSPVRPIGTIGNPQARDSLLPLFERVIQVSGNSACDVHAPGEDIE